MLHVGVGDQNDGTLSSVAVRNQGVSVRAAVDQQQVSCLAHCTDVLRKVNNQHERENEDCIELKRAREMIHLVHDSARHSCKSVLRLLTPQRLIHTGYIANAEQFLNESGSCNPEAISMH